MKKSLLIICLFVLTQMVFAAKEIVPMWVMYPEKTETNLADFYFKSEFKYKDSVSSATLKVASTGLYRLWINGKLVVLNGEATNNLSAPEITITDITKYIEKGNNTLTMCISPDANGSMPKQIGAAFHLLINNEFILVSDKETMSYSCDANQYEISNGLATFNYAPQKSVVGNWHEPGFNHKKFSPGKWLSAEETEIFKADSSSTLVVQPFSGLNEVKSLKFPLNIKSSETIVVPLGTTNAKQVRFSLESVKNKTVVIQTPAMKRLGAQYIYNTSFGYQIYEFPFLTESDTLIFEFTSPAKFNSVHYVELK